MDGLSKMVRYTIRAAWTLSLFAASWFAVVCIVTFPFIVIALLLRWILN